jgi:hypothetical protein
MLTVFLWLHVVCMVGTFGLLLGAQFGIPAEYRDSPEVAKKVLGLGNALVGVGLIAGLVVFVVSMHAFKTGGVAMPSGYHAIIGIKFILVFAVGACLGVSYPLLKKGNRGALSALRYIALALLALASFLGVSLGA